MNLLFYFFLQYCAILSIYKRGQINISHCPNKALRIQDSCRSTVRDGNCISTDVTEDAIEN